MKKEIEKELYRIAKDCKVPEHVFSNKSTNYATKKEQEKAFKKLVSNLGLR